MYPFDEKKQCSSASADQYDSFKEVDDLIQPPKIEMKRNIAWAFYSLQEDVNCDLRKYFKQEITTRDDFAYPRALTEDDRMACLEITIRNHYGL